jgi:hypothetical protein
MPVKKPKPKLPLYELKGAREKLYNLIRKKHPGEILKLRKSLHNL